MKNIKKILLGFSLLFITLLVNVDKVSAACSVSVSTTKNVIVGNTFKVSTTVSSDVGSWYYVLSYDSSKVQLISGNPKVVGVIGDGKTNTYTFKALRSGTANFSVVNTALASNSTNKACSASSGSASVIMKTQAEIEASYSRNNNLSGLQVANAELSPAFNPDVTEYSATLPVDTTKAVVTATAEDKTAQISGVGEIDVVDGLNKVEIVVTAQHGEKKTYTINLTVQELDPIKVKVGKGEYFIVRKKGQVENIPEGFSETTLKYEDQDVVAYKSEITKITLLALKDKDGLIELYIYNESNKSFEEFNELKGNSINLIILNGGKVPDGFEKASFKYENKTINGYKVKGSSDYNYYLVYAQNLENGNKGYYLYDTKDSSFQKYFDELDNVRQKEIKIRNYIILGFLSLCMLIIIVKIIKSFASKERKIKRLERKISKLRKEEKSDYYYELDDIDEKPEINKIEDEDISVPKKSRRQKKEELRKAKEFLDNDKEKIKRVSLDEDD